MTIGVFGMVWAFSRFSEHTFHTSLVLHFGRILSIEFPNGPLVLHPFFSFRRQSLLQKGPPSKFHTSQIIYYLVFQSLPIHIHLTEIAVILGRCTNSAVGAVPAPLRHATALVVSGTP
jgi:hypothetical protein